MLIREISKIGELFKTLMQLKPAILLINTRYNERPNIKIYMGHSLSMGDPLLTKIEVDVQTCMIP